MTGAEPVPNCGPAAQLALTPRASGLLRRGRPWFFRDDLHGSDPGPPRLVRIVDDCGRDLGLGITAPGKLALRSCGPWPRPDDAAACLPDREAFFQARLAAAIAARADRLGPDDGVRLVHGEADWLPGLVVDRYGPVLVVQVTSAFVEANLGAIVPWLAARLSAAAVVARNDLAVRRLEGLAEEVQLLHGRRVVETAITEGVVRHTVRPFTGHKTGMYLDQRPARALVHELARGRRALDLFAYQGGFALHALAGGAVSALAVDQSTDALAVAERDAAANGLGGLSVQTGNVFDVVRALRDRGEQFDLITLDPPPFAKTRREVAGAERGYRDLNRQALRLLAPHGLLLTCTCSHHMAPARFEEVVRQAAAGLPFRVLLRRRLGAGSDHPVVVTHPESEYLKVLLLQRAEPT